MRFARPVPHAVRYALAPALAALVFAAAGCSSKAVTPPPPLPPLSRIDLVPATDSLMVDATRQFVATAYDTLNAAVPDASFNWTTSNSGVVTVSQTGLARARGEGSAWVFASAGGRSDSALVYVYTQKGWYTQTSNTARNLYGVWFLPDGRTGVAVGALGTIVRTTDAGQTWTTVTSMTTNALYSVCFPTASLGWAAGDAGVVLRTTDAGLTWSRDLGVNASENLRCVRFADADHGWVVGSNGVVIRTADGGATWSRTHPTAQQLNGVSFPDTTNGWAVGGAGTILGTHDGGRSWYVVQPSVTGLALASVWRRSNTLAWGVGLQGARVSTSATADSLAWSVGSFGASNEMRGVMFVDDVTGYAVGFNGGGIVQKTLDGGANWSPQAANSSAALNGVFFVDGLRGWAVGDAGRIVHTSVGGNL